MKDDSLAEFVMDQLRDLGEVACRSMFGGQGLYQGEVFFGIIYKGRLYFKTDPATRMAYQERGMTPFRPNARQALKTYYEVPAEMMEDAGLLTEWARAAVRTQPAGTPSRNRRRSSRS